MDSSEAPITDKPDEQHDPSFSIGFVAPLEDPNDQTICVYNEQLKKNEVREDLIGNDVEVAVNESLLELCQGGLKEHTGPIRNNSPEGAEEKEGTLSHKYPWTSDSHMAEWSQPLHGQDSQPCHQYLNTTHRTLGSRYCVWKRTAAGQTTIRNTYS